ncbi:MAG: cache domain-containing protein, partial [Oxalicibacterium faecigallinarum]|uniref:cache domain-containing protein n=1 Tax=Oxalicibacterium faecigallinarum TaxID=573741 RepID=UPI002809E1DE
MKTKRAPTIRFKLITLVLACVVPASLMAVLFIAHDYQRARDHLLFNLLTTARTMMAVVDRDIASIESALNALATSQHLDDHNFGAFYTQAKRIQDASENISITLLDASGTQVFNTRYPYNEMLADYSLSDEFQTIQDTGKPLISNLFVSKINPRPLLAIGVPVQAGGHANRYTLHATINPERLEKLLQQQGLPAEWISAVFDGSGTIIARNREMSRFVGRKGSPDLLENIAAGNNSFVSTTHDGVTVYTVISHSSVSNWSLGIGIPTRLIDNQLRITLWWLVLATITLLATSLGAAWLIGGRIAESIRGLTGPALALGSGEVVSIPPLHLREADEVGSSLIKVSEMLHRAQHLANHDVLTGLANRALFNEMVEQHLSLCERNNSTLSILY